MSEWLLKFSEWCQQAWVYIPAVLSFITAIGLPSLVQIAKIFKSAKLYLTQTKSLMGKFNEVVKVVKQLIEFIKTLRGDIEQFLKDEIDYDEKRLQYTYNAKEKEAIRGHIKYLKEKLDSVQKLGELPEVKEFTQEELNLDKKKIKVKVKEKDE